MIWALVAGWATAVAASVVLGGPLIRTQEALRDLTERFGALQRQRRADLERMTQLEQALIGMQRTLGRRASIAETARPGTGEPAAAFYCRDRDVDG